MTTKASALNRMSKALTRLSEAGATTQEALAAFAAAGALLRGNQKAGDTTGTPNKPAAGRE